MSAWKSHNLIPAPAKLRNRIPFSKTVGVVSSGKIVELGEYGSFDIDFGQIELKPVFFVGHFPSETCIFGLSITS